MGSSPFELQQKLRQTALDIAIEAGALSRCEYHEHIVTTNEDEDAERLAYKIASKRYKGSRDLTKVKDAIKSEMVEAPFHCAACDKLFGPD